MDYITFELNLAQLNRCIQKTKTNKYADTRKADYQKSLVDLYDKISAEDFSLFNEKELVDRKRIIDFVFNSIQYLDNSTLTITPFEIVFCLEKILEDWIPNHNYIIVTSLNNRLKSYEISSYLTLDEPIHQLINDKYGIVFKFRLIQITLPRYYVHDYLVNAALYHELGHFIDLKYKISERYILDQYKSKNLPSSAITIDLINQKNKEEVHCKEHFADIFASQYIGNSLNHFLNYISYKQPASSTHPSTIDRIKKVEDFLANVTTDKTINDLKSYTSILCNKELEIRHKAIPLDDFKNLIPVEIESESDLHSVILAGWNFWRSRPNDVMDKLNQDVTYKVINNLIEKSISNYIVRESWNS